MIGYVTLGTNKMDEAAAFYDALLGELGANRMMEADTFIAWTTSPGAPAISIRLRRSCWRPMKSIRETRTLWPRWLR